MRQVSISRKTSETHIELTLNLDGSGQGNITSGVGFLDHMLTLFTKHAHFDLHLVCQGDTYVDDHHSTEDIGVVLGEALAKSLGNKAGVMRYGSMLLPMDEALVLCAVDLSGRSCLRFQADFSSSKVGTFDTELVEEFLTAFVRSAGITLHIKQLDGKNTHHIIEAMFKALGRSLRTAVRIDPLSPDEIPSTKGVL